MSLKQYSSLIAISSGKNEREWEAVRTAQNFHEGLHAAMCTKDLGQLVTLKTPKRKNKNNFVPRWWRQQDVVREIVVRCDADCDDVSETWPPTNSHLSHSSPSEDLARDCGWVVSDEQKGMKQDQQERKNSPKPRATDVKSRSVCFTLAFLSARCAQILQETSYSDSHLQKTTLAFLSCLFMEEAKILCRLRRGDVQVEYSVRDRLDMLPSNGLSRPVR